MTFVYTYTALSDIFLLCCFFFFFFFFNDTATTEIYTLSLHDALPIFSLENEKEKRVLLPLAARPLFVRFDRSEEHTYELQSPDHLVCRLLLEKKKKYIMSKNDPI